MENILANEDIEEDRNCNNTSLDESVIVAAINGCKDSFKRSLMSIRGIYTEQLFCMLRMNMMLQKYTKIQFIKPM